MTCSKCAALSRTCFEYVELRTIHARARQWPGPYPTTCKLAQSTTVYECPVQHFEICICWVYISTGRAVTLTEWRKHTHKKAVMFPTLWNGNLVGWVCNSIHWRYTAAVYMRPALLPIHQHRVHTTTLTVLGHSMYRPASWLVLVTASGGNYTLRCFPFGKKSHVIKDKTWCILESSMYDSLFDLAFYLGTRPVYIQIDTHGEKSMYAVGGVIIDLLTSSKVKSKEPNCINQNNEGKEVKQLPPY